MYVSYLCFIPTVEENFARKSEDVMLGTVKVPLIDLIHKRTGISHSFIN